MTGLSPDERRLFDEELEAVLAELPNELTGLFDEIPLVVEDHPSREMLRELDIARPEYLCGLHTGVPLTERSVRHSGVLPTVITIYRLGVLCAATSRRGHFSQARLHEQIRKTVLHELGHYFGMDEDDLRRYGYA
jgi:predicted Zn-dependent protease with MMP-like domain